jgi:hypothetical protein
VLINDTSNTNALKAFRVVGHGDTFLMFDPPTLANGKMTLSWDSTGTLQESTDLETWTDSPVQTNPQQVDVGGTMKFYRLSRP